MHLSSRPRPGGGRHGKAWRYAIILPVVLFALVVGIGLYRTGRHTLANLQRALAPELERQLGREVTIGRVRVTASGRLVAERVAIADGPTFRSGTVLRARRAVVGIRFLDVIRHRRARVGSIAWIRVEDPELLLVRDASGHWNVSDLAKGPRAGGAKGAFRGQVVVTGGRVEVRDHRSFIRPGPAVTRLRDLSVVVDAARASAITVNGSARGDLALGRLTLSGSYENETRALEARAQFADADLPYWQRYFRAARNLPARSGKASGSVQVSWRPGAAPRIRGTVRSPRLVTNSRALRVPLVGEPVTAKIDNNRITLDARGRVGETSFSLDGTVMARAGRATQDLRLRFPAVALADLQKVVRNFPSTRGVVWDAPAEATAHVHGGPKDYQVDVQARVARGSARGVAFRDASADVTYYRATQRADIRRLEGRAAGGRVAARGQVALQPPSARLSLTGEASGVTLAQLPIRAATRLQGVADVRFRAVGPLGAVGVSLAASGSDIALGQARLGRVAAEVAMTPGAAPVVRARAARLSSPGGAGFAIPALDSAAATFEVLPDSVRLREARALLSGTPIRLSGTVGHAGDLDLALVADDASAAVLGRALKIEGLQGTARIQAHVTGTTTRPRIAGSASVGRGRVRSLAFAQLDARFDMAGASDGLVSFTAQDTRVGGVAARAASGQIQLKGKEIRLRDVKASLPGGSLRAQGSSLPSGLDLSVQVSGVDAAALARMAGLDAGAALPLTGRIAFNGRVRGSLDSPALEGVAVVTQGAFRGIRFDELRGQIQAGKDGMTVSNLALRRGEGALALAGTVEIRAKRAPVLQGRLRAHGVDLAEIAGALRPGATVAGRADLDLQIAGAFPDITASGRFGISGARLAGITFQRLAGRLHQEGDRTRIEEIAAEDGGARLVASGTYGPGGRLDLRIRGQQVPLERLQQATKALPLSLAGRADLDGTLAGTSAAPRFEMSIRTGPVVINGQALDSVAGRFSYDGAEVLAADVSLTYDGTAYRVDRLAYRPKEQRVGVQASVSDADLERLSALARSMEFPDTPTGKALAARVAALPSPLKGRLTGTVTLAGRLPDPAGQAEFALTDATLGEARVGRFAGRIAWNSTRFELYDAALVADGVDLAGSVLLGPGDQVQVAAALKPSRLEALRALAALFPGGAGGPGAAAHAAVRRLPQPLSGRVSGDITLQGRTSALEGKARLSLQDARLGETRMAHASGTAQWQAGSLIVEDLALRAQGVDLQGTIRQEAGRDLTVALQTRDTDLAAARDLVRSLASLAGEYRGAPALPAAVTEVLADDSTLAGRATLAFTLSGRPGRWQGTLSAQGTGIRFGETAIPSLVVEGSWSPSGVRFPTLALTGEDLALTGSLETGAGGRIAADIATENADVQQLRRLIGSMAFLRHLPQGRAILDRVASLPEPLSGTLSAKAHVAGTPGNLLGSVTLTGTDLVVGGQKLAEVAAAGDIRGETITVQRLQARANGGTLQAVGRVDLAGRVDLSLTGQHFALAALQPWVGRGQPAGADGVAPLQGYLDVQATVRGPLAAPEIRAQLAMDDATIAGMRWKRIRAADVRVAEGRIDLGRVELARDDLSGTVSGFVPFHWRSAEIPSGEPIQLAVALPPQSFSLASGLPAALQSVAGTMTANLSVTGTLRNPDMGGTVTIDGGRVKLAGVAQAFTGVSGQLRLEGASLVLEGLQGRSERGGTVAVAGRAVIQEGSIRSVDLRLRAAQLQVAMQNALGVPGLDFTGSISTPAGRDVVLAGQVARPTLAGKILLSHAQVSVPSAIPERSAAEQRAFNPALDLEVALADGAALRRGRAISAVVTGGLLARGTLNNPMVGGRIAVERGEMSYAGTNYKLQPGGSVSFSYDPPAPLSARLDVTADTRMRVKSPTTNESRNYTITLHLTGAVPNVNVAVSSDPPDLPQYRMMAILSRTDQLDALTQNGDLDGLLRDQALNVVAGTVLPQVFEPIEEGIAQALGLDDVSFDYGFDRPLRVDARKEVLPRLFVSYNRDMGAGTLLGEKEQWSITYRVYQRLFVGWRRETMSSKERLVIEGSFRF